jgi:hypothetical protein
MNEEDFGCMSNLLPHMEPVHVAARTVQEAISVNYLKIFGHDIIYDIIPKI